MTGILTTQVYFSQTHLNVTPGRLKISHTYSPHTHIFPATTDPAILLVWCLPPFMTQRSMESTCFDVPLYLSSPGLFRRFMFFPIDSKKIADFSHTCSEIPQVQNIPSTITKNESKDDIQINLNPHHQNSGHNAGGRGKKCQCIFSPSFSISHFFICLFCNFLMGLKMGFSTFFLHCSETFENSSISKQTAEITQYFFCKTSTLFGSLFAFFPLHLRNDNISKVGIRNSSFWVITVATDLNKSFYLILNVLNTQICTSKRRTKDG